MKRLLTVVLLIGLSLGTSAQQPLDRKKVPTPGKPPTLRVPVWTKSVLGNGADLIVAEKHDLPLVSFSISFVGGAAQIETDRQGAASLIAPMLSEGTKTRNAEALSDALQLLGTSVSATVGSESGTMSFVSTTSKFPATLDILADMLVHPVFPADALERLRGQRLVALAQAKAQPGAIAGRVFPRILYGSGHPYSRIVVTEESIKAVTRDDVVALHQAYFRPRRALVTVVGDVTPAAVKPVIERALSAWSTGGERPSFSYPPAAALKTTTIFLVDKPGAAQSTFAIGKPGPPRSTPDYFALQVMNTMLGGMFQSRLNANIREEKGYSYGVFSSFAYGKGPGPFRTGGDIVTEKTDAALVEFLKELRGILGARPITDDELATAKDSLIQRLPGTFASVSAINSALTTLWTEGLPDDYYQRYAKSIAAVTKDDVLRVAKAHIDLEHLAIVIVGDRATIEAPLRKSGIAPIVFLDIEGKPLPPP